MLILKNFTIEKSYILKYFIILDHHGFISNRNPTNTNDMFPARTGAKWFHIILHFIIEKNVDYEVVIYLSTSKVRKSFTLKYFKINI